MITLLKRRLSFTGTTLVRLSGEIRGLHAAAYVLAGSALLSSLLALFRDRILASTFGAGYKLDLYYAAFRIPDLLFVIFGGLVSVYVLIPALARRTETEQRAYIDTILLGFSLLVLVATATTWMVAPYLLSRFFPAIVAGVYGDQLVVLTRLLLAQPILLAASNIVAAITQSRHRYLLYAASPIVYNLGIIFGLVVLYPLFGLRGVVGGVLIGALLHLFIQLPSAWRDGFFQVLPRFRDWRGFFDTVRISIPRAAALSIGQITFLGLMSFAGLLAAGSISIFVFAYNLQAVPLAIIGASYSVAAFPSIAAAFGSGKRTEFLNNVYEAARQILFWSLPATALLIVLRAHLVRTVLGAGAFDWTDTRLTAAAVALFAFSLTAQGLSLLVVRACYAAGKTLVPFVIALFSGALALLLGTIFLRMFAYDETGAFIEVLLRVEDVAGSDMLALVLAYSASMIVSALLYVAYFEIRFGHFISEISRAWWQGLTAAFVGALATYGTLYILGDITFASTLVSVFLRGFLAGVVGIIAISMTYRQLGSREYAAAIEGSRKRFWREAKPVSSAEAAEVPRV